MVEQDGAARYVQARTRGFFSSNCFAFARRRSLLLLLLLLLLLPAAAAAAA